MDLALDDDVFIRATPPLVYRRLADPTTYPTWWPGFRLLEEHPVGDTWDAEAVASGDLHTVGVIGRPREPGAAWFRCELKVPRVRPIRLTCRPYRFRPGKGIYLDLDGDVVGTLEWWLEEGYGGVVVHHLARSRVADHRRRPTSVVRAYRWAHRRAMWGLKDVVQSEVRELVGLEP